MGVSTGGAIRRPCVTDSKCYMAFMFAYQPLRFLNPNDQYRRAGTLTLNWRKYRRDLKSGSFQAGRDSHLLILETITMDKLGIDPRG